MSPIPGRRLLRPSSDNRREIEHEHEHEHEHDGPAESMLSVASARLLPSLAIVLSIAVLSACETRRGRGRGDTEAPSPSTSGSSTELEGAELDDDQAGDRTDDTPPTRPGGGLDGPGTASRGGTASGAAAVCARWRSDRVLDEGTWTGSVSGCKPGDISAEARANALRLVNLYRSLANLPAVETSSELDASAQSCALLMHANDALSHTPPKSWKCWSDRGSKAAGSSNISTQAGVGSVDGYMIDDGNDTTLGHRRWILSNGFGPIGLGSTSEMSCMWVFGDTMYGAGPAYTSWPPAGVVPVEVFRSEAIWWTDLDQVGWSVQSDVYDLTTATVTVTEGGKARPVSVYDLEPGYGSQTAIRFTPNGWTTKVGATYHVAVSGVSTPFDYYVEVVGCE